MENTLYKTVPFRWLQNKKKIQSILLYVESLIENSVTVTSLKHQLQLNMASLPRRLRM